MKYRIEVSPKSGIFLANTMLSLCWLSAWRDHIKNAYAYPSEADGYCRAAVIAQAQYMMAEVLIRR